MSGFSEVDQADDPKRLEAYLDLTARGQTAMKHYIAAAHAREGIDRVLDIGCGGGHDLELLAADGRAAVGIDPSVTLLAAARTRLRDVHPPPPLMRARGEAIPLRTGSVGGCRIDRVLQHVADPAAVLSEAFRCVRPGGLLTAFEPDWLSLQFPSAGFGPDASWLANVRQPAVGRRLPDLVEGAGGLVLDRVEEHSVWTSLARAERLVGITAGLQRHVEGGRFTPAQARTWLAEQRAKDRAGRFRATFSKVLVVART